MRQSRRRRSSLTTLSARCSLVFKTRLRRAKMRCINLPLKFVVSVEEEEEEGLIFSNLSVTNYLLSRRVKPSISLLIKPSLALRILVNPLLNPTPNPFYLALSPLLLDHSLPRLPPLSLPIRFVLLPAPLRNDLSKYATNLYPVKLESNDIPSSPSPSRNLSTCPLSNPSSGLRVPSKSS